MLFRPGRVLALVAVVLLAVVVVFQLIPTDSPAPTPSTPGSQPNQSAASTTPSNSDGGLVDAQVMQQVSAIEAKHQQWDASTWADELSARDHGESIIQLWDNLLAGADAFAMLAAADAVPRAASPSAVWRHVASSTPSLRRSTCTCSL